MPFTVGVSVCVQAILLIGMIVTVLFRPERIHSLRMFRRACILFAASLILPAVVHQFQILVHAAGMGSSTSSAGELTVAFIAFSDAFGQILFSASLMFFLLSLVANPDALPPLRPKEYPFQ